MGVQVPPRTLSKYQCCGVSIWASATKAWASGLRLSDPVMVAVTADATRPNASLDRAVHDIERLTGAVSPGVVRWLPWHRIAEIFGGLDRLQANEQALVDDVLRLMDKRGVRKVFTGFPNARATRPRSARPATVTLSRTTSPAISAPALSRPHHPEGSHRVGGRTHGDARSTQRHASSRNPRPARPVRGCRDCNFGVTH
jgi:hypothetical protein